MACTLSGSVLKPLLQLRDEQPPRTIMVIESYGVPGLAVVEALVQQYLNRRFTVHYLAPSFVRRKLRLPDDANIEYHHNTYNDYDKDSGIFYKAVQQLSKPKKSWNNKKIPRMYLTNFSHHKNSTNLPMYKNETETVVFNDKEEQIGNVTETLKRSSISPPTSSLSSNNTGQSTARLLVVDKLEDLLMHHSLRHVIAELKTLTEGGCHVLLWTAEDALPPQHMAALRSVVPAVLCLRDNLACTAGASGIDVLSRVIKTSLKVIKSEEALYLKRDQQNRISITTAPLSTAKTILKTDESSLGVTSSISPNLNVIASTSDNKKEAVIPKKPNDDINSQTTFSLTLSVGERAAKNSLLLPHQRVMPIHQGTGGGTVHYTLDSEDWDEEDPDDDLDI